MIELNCKVIKKVASPHFYINPPFQVYTPFLAKKFVPPPQVTQFLEGPTPPLIEGGVPNMLYQICIPMFKFLTLNF